MRRCWVGRWIVASTDELRRATNRWTSPLVVRTYETDERGQRAFQDEAHVLLLHGGYAAEEQTVDGGHIHAGRLIVTGGWSVLAGRRGIRSKSKLTVTFKKLTGPPVNLIVEHAMRGRSDHALAEIAGRDIMGAAFPRRLLTNVPLAHAEAVANHLRQHACRVGIELLDEEVAPAQAPDFLDQLERLAALHERGVLTDEEFATKKAEILGSGRTVPTGASHRHTEQLAFDVVLTDFVAEREAEVVEALVEVNSILRWEARQLVESAPSFVRKRVGKEEAEALKTKLEETGATIELR